MKTKIAIFDDNKNIRNSILLLLGTQISYEVVGVYRDAEDCVRRVRDCGADVVLMDIEMPGKNGIDAVRQLKTELPHLMILIQTVFEDEDKIFESIRAGASGYLLKSAINHSLIKSIEELLNGGAPMTPLVARKLLYSIHTNVDQNKPMSTSINYGLTNKEREVLSCIVRGMSYKMVGHELNITYDTVRSHVKKIYEKLHVASLTEAVAKAVSQRIV